jgi:predicted enzyme related to lactoylglutathione lyase
MTTGTRLMVRCGAVMLALLAGAATSDVAQAQGAAPAGDVVGAGNFIHVVADLDRTMAFYGALLGVEPNGGARPREYGDNPPVATMYNTPGSRFRGATFRVPNSDLALEFIDWEDNPAAAVEARVFDPGAPIIILQLSDLDAALAAVSANGGTTLTEAPVRFSSERFSPRRLAIVQDPDGYFIEFIAPDEPLAADEPGNVRAATFRATTTDADRTARFFTDAFGFEVAAAGAFNDDPVLGEMMGVGVAPTRFARTTVPGSGLGVQFAEYRGLGGRTVEQGLPRPGTSMLRLMVGDLDRSVAKAVAAGATIAPGNDPAVTLTNGRRMAVVIDPDGLSLQLAEAP